MKPPLAQGHANDFQTPKEALYPLYKYIKKDWLIWECACGKNNLVNGLNENGYLTQGTDMGIFDKKLSGKIISHFIRKSEGYEIVIT